MKDICSTIQKWKLAHANHDLTNDDATLCDVAFEELFPHPVSEAKLAAILILQEHVFD
jgi:hypothetical protein